MKEISDRMCEGSDTIDTLIERGIYESSKPNSNVAEYLRVFWKAHGFREWDYQTGVQKRISYVVMQEVYQDFDCGLPYSSFIEIFPLMDEMFVQASMKKASEKKPSK